MNQTRAAVFVIAALVVTCARQTIPAPSRHADKSAMGGGGSVQPEPALSSHAHAITGFHYAGKTGSGEAPPLGGVEADDTWFIAYAPPADPRIVVGARVERADRDKDSPLVARKVLEAWRANDMAHD